MIILTLSSFMTNAAGGWGANWLPLCVGAVITAIMFHIGLLMVGRAFSIKELEAYAQSEMLQAAATFFMVVFLVVMVGDAMNLASGYIAGDVKIDVPADLLNQVPCAKAAIHISSTPAAPYSLVNGVEVLNPSSTMNNAYDAIKCRLQARAVEVAAVQDAIINDYQTALDFNTLNMQFSFFGITVFRGDWNSALYKSTETKRITNNLATVLLIGLDAQGALVEYLKYNMLDVFLPVGLLLRCFYLTRGAGALMMSVGIGMYFVFPVFFVLLDPGFTPAPPPTVTPAPAGQPYCYATMGNTVSLLSSVQSSGTGTTAALDVEMNRNDLTAAYVSLMIHPLIALLLTLVFIRYMMTILGGDPSDLTRMMGKVI